MAFKVFVFIAYLTVVQAGAPIGFHQAHPLSTGAFQASPAPVAVTASAPIPHYAAGPVAYAYSASPFAKIAAPVAYAAPIAKAVIPELYNAYPEYSFLYGVEDPLAGDSKNQEEHRVKDVVHGSYSLTDSDGYCRIVQCTADPINALNAVVHRQPIAVPA